MKFQKSFIAKTKMKTFSGDWLFIEHWTEHWTWHCIGASDILQITLCIILQIFQTKLWMKTLNAFQK